jgi:hypothetical protein
MSWRITASTLVPAILVGALAFADPPPRSVLYPRSRPQLRFPHAKHAELPCARCHDGVQGSVSASDRHAPREAVCRSCHAAITRADDGPRARLSGTSRCAVCHVGYGGSGVPARVQVPPARLRLSHRLHVERGVLCADCHAPGEDGQPSLPPMAACLGCHRARKTTDRCTACHLSREDGRLQTRFGEARLEPSGSLRGAAHTPLFKRRHGQLGGAQRRYCDSCHRPAECLKCHAGTLRPMSIHDGDYVTHHALDAERAPASCQSCHRSQTFCLSCHQRLGVAPSSRRGGFRPGTGKAFHPPGFNTLQPGPNHHGFAARRNIRSCVSCHQEEGCIRCHGSRSTGKGGFSPHPPDFGRSSRCRALASRNKRACLKCHSVAEVSLGCR